MLYQEKLKEICIFCESKINSVKESESFFEKPFKHAVIDNFLPNKFAELALKSFPSSHDPCWEHTNDEGIEVKSRSAWKSEFDIPDGMVDVIRVLNSSILLKAMSKLLDIPKLMPDPYFTGGGLNMSQKGGHLDVHVDGNYHDASGLNRRVNLLIYLNPNWNKQWGGEFGVYSADGSELVHSIDPIHNRCVIFDSHDKSYHGLPNPINFPKNDPRRSIILYYYTAEKRPTYQIEVDEPHSALWRSKGFVDKKGNKKRKYT